MNKSLLSIYRNTSRLACVIVFAMLLGGCPKFISDFDSITYKALIDARTEILELYEDLAKSRPENEQTQKTIKRLNLSLKKLRAYSAEKGPKNKETIKSIDILIRQYNRHIGEWLKNPWTNADKENKKENIGDNFGDLIELQKKKPNFK